MSRLTYLATFAAFSASSLFAQQVAGEAPKSTDAPLPPVVGIQANEEIVPASARNVMGGSSNSIPWSWTPTHFMSCYLGSELPQKTYLIRCIGFRSNNRVDTGATIDIEIWLGKTTNDHTNLSTTYASNYNIASKPRVQVLTRQKIKLADMVKPGNTDPSFFQYQIPLSKPFIYTSVKGENLVFECKVHGNSSGNTSFSFFPDNEAGAGTTTTRLWSNNNANATTGNVGRSYGPVLKFDVKCKVNGDGTDYESGSTVPLVPGNPWIKQPAWSRNYADTRGYPRGWWGKIPKNFILTGVRVPNEASNAMQTVAVYELPAAPPQFPTAYTPKAAEVRMFVKDAKAGTILKPARPLAFTKDKYLLVLGVTHGAAQSVTSSYSAGGAYQTNILGASMTIQRALSQTVLRGTTNGITGIAGNGAFNHGRVELHVLGQANFNPIVPVQTTSKRPVVGQTAELSTTSNIKGAQAGVTFLAASRLPKVATPFGNLLFNPGTAVLTIPGPGAGGKIPLPLPNSSNLVSVKVVWQTFFFDFTNKVYGSTNGTEWLIGEQ